MKEDLTPQEIHDLIMSLPEDPNKPPPPPAPARLEDAKTVAEIDAYLMASSVEALADSNQAGETNEPQ